MEPANGSRAQQLCAIPRSPSGLSDRRQQAAAGARALQAGGRPFEQHESVGSDDLGRTVVDLVPEFVKRTELPVGREKTVTLEEELKHLEANESALEQRTNSLALANGLGLISGILAFGLALLALVVALSNRDNNNGTGQMRSGSAGAAMGAGAMMGSTAAGNAARPVCERSTSSSARCG